ncbi:hypothetical protein GQ42DRAFT_143166 [Ramicandelaber brevisporus]|nr:hypothetical protein GQ42DRAFT_143166 [Ramicandelaber brevisporus]
MTDEQIQELANEKQAWVRTMRLKFCRRPDAEETHRMIDDEGNLNHAYFQDSPSTMSTGPRKWTEVERGLLIQGIEKYGIGHFREISEALLPAWSTNDLRLKTIRLIGRQNLQLYKDWKGDEQAIMAEYELNKQVGLEFSTWKGGVLVYDDDGNVLRRLTEK